MTTHKEKTVITFEEFKRTTIRTGSKSRTAWCEHCRAETVMIAPDIAAAQLKTTARDIFRLTEAGELHFLETTSGALLVCSDSCRTRLRERTGEGKLL